jgi:hypothetical protein
MVTDGVGLQHPCCRIHDCHESLPNSKARFCLTHAALENECATIGCNNTASPGFKTCSDTTCRELELNRLQPEKAMFQLKERLAYHRRRVFDNNTLAMDPLLSAAMASSQETGDDEDDAMDFEFEDEMAVEEDPSNIPTEACKGKESVQKKGKKAKAFFGRRRTHNEELAVMSCGVIIGRATFYGSEAANGVLVCRF